MEQLTEGQLKEKCKELKRKILQVEENNKLASLAISRTKISVNRLRLEYSILLERLESRSANPDVSDGSDSEDIELSDKKINKKKRIGYNGNGQRDPDLPKRPLNPYLIFCDIEKEKFKKQAEAEGKAIDLSKTLSEAWKNLGQEGRQPYIDIYNEDKERYLKEMSEYEANTHKRAKIEDDVKAGPADEVPVKEEEREDSQIEPAIVDTERTESPKSETA